ncbi:hypothetical protein EXIGLDRAFT_839202 [Exidia glandulosa HHB12029]|uniref:Uncharacterized protein n=1 Tax=Exidia glandulosa HHB12029 TaxID=1314781 RepID=A0A165F6Z4_EXIGL|nr:hypothetical protein EXIGLDRAFT_839202 [Exidia glandulosa HHB12029]
MVALHRRETQFSQFSGPYDKPSIAIACLCLVAGIVQLALSIFAVVRLKSHRAPFVLLVLAVACYVVSRGISIAMLAWPMSYWDVNWTDFRGDPSYNIVTNSDTLATRTVGVVMASFADALALGSCMLVLWDRRAALATVYSKMYKRQSVAKKIFDVLLVLLMMGLAIGRTSYSALAFSSTAVRNGTIQPEKLQHRQYAAQSLDHAYIAFFIVTVLNVAVTAFSLRSSIKRVGARDVPTRKVARLLTLLWLIHVGYWTFADVWATLQVNTNPTVGTTLLERVRTLQLVDVLDASVLPSFIFAALLHLGLSRSAWETFEDHPRTTVPEIVHVERSAPPPSPPPSPPPMKFEEYKAEKFTDHDVEAYQRKQFEANAFKNKEAEAEAESSSRESTSTESAPPPYPHGQDVKVLV